MGRSHAPHTNRDSAYPGRGPAATPRTTGGHVDHQRALTRALLSLVLWGSLGATPSWAHDPGISSSTWRLDRGRLRGTLVLAEHDAAALGVTPTTAEMNLDARAELVARVVSVSRGEVALAPAAATIRQNPDDPLELQIDVIYDAGTAGVVLRWPGCARLPWGHRHHAKVLLPDTGKFLEALIADADTEVSCDPAGHEASKAARPA
ncbi:MAG: hypothetical protein AB7O52_08930 [Planctomycetota bacterium]